MGMAAGNQTSSKCFKLLSHLSRPTGVETWMMINQESMGMEKSQAKKIANACWEEASSPVWEQLPWLSSLGIWKHLYTSAGQTLGAGLVLPGHTHTQMRHGLSLVHDNNKFNCASKIKAENPQAADVREKLPTAQYRPRLRLQNKGCYVKYLDFFIIIIYCGEVRHLL